MLLWTAVLLPSLILATDTNWQYQIYVSSSDIRSSCWNGSVSYNTLNLALQGVQHNSTVIYLYPGIYTLDDEVRNISRVAIIGLSNDVTISCHQSVTGQWLDNVSFYCITFYNCPTTISNSIPCPYHVTKGCDYCEGDKLNVNVLGSLSAYPSGDDITFTAFLYDSCSDRMYIESTLRVCIVSGPESVKLCSTNSNCTNTSINSLNQYSFSICYFGKEMTYGSTIDINVEIFTKANVSSNTIIKVRPYCYSIEGIYNNTSGKCAHIQNTYSLPHSSRCSCYSEPKHMYMYTNTTCTSNTIVSICGSCEDNYSVPINLPNKCVQCDDPDDPLHIPKGWILFVTVQLLPVTVMVLLIIVLNIQLTSGTFNALVFYSQILTTVYPSLTFNGMFGSILSTKMYYYDAPILHFSKLFLIPFNILNLDFTLFFGTYPLCISSATTPLEAVLFRCLIGLYPLVLLLLLYVWITLYNKGYKVIVLITRPIHRLIARFWHMTNIEPSLPHSIASIYLLCFMQLATTSFKLILFSFQKYTWFYISAGIFAILVLILLVLIPMLYIQLYPFKLFHKLLECLYLNKLQILTSLGDVFTGPYKNGTINKLDYRYFAGIYLLLRIIILLLHFIPIFVIIPSLQTSIFFFFFGAILIFCPYQRNINNFNVFFNFLFLAIFSVISAASEGCCAIVIYSMVLSFDAIVFLIWFGYFIYWTVKKIRSCYGYNKAYRAQRLNNTTSDAVDNAL